MINVKQAIKYLISKIKASDIRTWARGVSTSINTASELHALFPFVRSRHVCRYACVLCVPVCGDVYGDIYKGRNFAPSSL